MIISNEIKYNAGSQALTAENSALQAETQTNPIQELSGTVNAPQSKNSYARVSNSDTNEAKENLPGQTSTMIQTESDGSTVLQYTSISPNGAIMRKNVLLHRANKNMSENPFASNIFDPNPMLRLRSEAFEVMML